MQATKEPVSQAAKPAPAHPGPPKSVVREYAEMILVTGVQVLFLMTFIAQAMNVPTGSMQNTINIGDQFFVNKFMLGRPTPLIGPLLPQRDVRRGDIVVFKLPKDPKVNYIKRVIGVPGDELQVRGTKVFIKEAGDAEFKELPEQRVFVQLGNPSNSALRELRTEPAPPNALYKTYHEDTDRGEFHAEFVPNDVKFGVREPLKIPEGSYFVMGDSRDNSLDSRYWGLVPRDHIIGRPLYVYWSFNPRDENASQTGNFLRDFFANINWKRLGTAIK
jgi:signal peptidase I